jgi:hypothetical protein
LTSPEALNPAAGGSVTPAPLLLAPSGEYEPRQVGGDVLAISIPRTETAVIRHFQERMPYGLFVPDGAVGAYAMTEGGRDE